MKASELDILVIPGRGGIGEGHWQSRWVRRLSSAIMVEQDDWTGASRSAWSNRVIEQAAIARQPVALVGHGLGVAAIAHAASALSRLDVRAGFLVAPVDVDENLPPHADPSFAPMPEEPLPFPALLVASRNDPACRFDRAGELALAWGASLIDAGEGGALDEASGHGPWPEALLTFARFVADLRDA